MTKSPFWRFLPEAVPPDAASMRRAARAGKGALARALREARQMLGTGRAAALLRAAGRDDDPGRRVAVLLIAPFQPRAIEDALQVAFAVADLTVDIRSVDGFAGVGTSDDAVFRDIDMVFVPVLVAQATAPALGGLLGEIARRCDAPVVVATIGRNARVRDGAAPRAELIDIPFEGPVLDERFGRTFGAIPTAEAGDRLADAAAGVAARIAGTAPKLIVTDLDGTLWRGVLGEDRADALDLHRPYATTLKDLSARGLVLAIASRNEADDVDAAFASHPEWPIGRSDFATASVGWDTKDALVAQLLERLNLHAEHLLVIDDDPVNCARLAERFPDADVRLFGSDADAFANDLAADPMLLSTGSDVSDRTLQYQRRERVERWRDEAPTVAEFLRRLQTSVTVLPLTTALHPRAAELASRVNQFATNECRPGIVELRQRASPLDFMVRLDDAFGSHGLVGLVLARKEQGSAVVDGFFLSCRAFGRGIEDAMVLALKRLAAARSCHRLVGTIDYLARNEPARRYFSSYLEPEHGCAWVILVDGVEDAPEGVTIRWEKTT